MKKFSINCDFNGQQSPVTFYIGIPEASHHPLHFQADWLSRQRGGIIPGDIMDAMEDLNTVSKKNNLLLEDLCVYALQELEEEMSAESDDE